MKSRTVPRDTRDGGSSKCCTSDTRVEQGANKKFHEERREWLVVSCVLRHPPRAGVPKCPGPGNIGLTSNSREINNPNASIRASIQAEKHNLQAEPDGPISDSRGFASAMTILSNAAVRRLSPWGRYAPRPL